MAGAGIRIDVTVQDQEVRAALARLIAKAIHPGPALLEIGEELIISTRKTLDSGHGPNDEVWPANSATTLERKLGKIKSRKSNVTKSGGLSKRGRTAHGKQKVLFETGALHDRLAKQLVDGGHGVEVGTNEPYGAAQHCIARSIDRARIETYPRERANASRRASPGQSTGRGLKRSTAATTD